MINREFFLALDELEKTSKLSKEVIIDAYQVGLAAALKKLSGKNRAVYLALNPESSEIRCYAYYEVVEEEEEPEKHFIPLSQAIEIKPDVKVGDRIVEEIELTSDLFTRVAAQNASQIINQRINDAKKELAHDEMTKREGELVQAIVRRIEPKITFLEILGTQMEAIMFLQDQVYNEKLNVGERVKVYVKKVRENNKGHRQILVSRSDAGYVKKLFEIEVPEIRSKLVKIKNVAREAGFRTKIAVYSDDPNVDATGACIGQRGARVNGIVSELNGEKVDVILYSKDPKEYITRALSPATVLHVKVDEEEKTALVLVPDDKLSLAIGKHGQNAKLAARLTEYRIDVKPHSQYLESDEG